MSTLYDKARALAVKAHAGQKYGDEPYTVHLDEVEEVLVEFGFDDELHRAAAQLHDTLEDTPLLPGRIMVDFGVPFGMATLFVTDDEGGNRRTRKWKTYVRAIRVIVAWEQDRKEAWVPLAVRVKLADRIANIRRSRGGNLMKMYRKERETFRLAYYSDLMDVGDMWNEYDNLFR